MRTRRLSRRLTEATATRRPRKKFSGQKAELTDLFHRSAVLSSVLCVASHLCYAVKDVNVFQK